MTTRKIQEPVSPNFQVPDEKAEIKVRLKEMIKTAGGAKKVSDLTGIPLTTLHSYTSGDSEPKFTVAALIASACGVSLQWLAYGQGQKEAGHFKGWEPEDVHPIGQIAQVVYEAIYDAQNLVPPDTFMNLMTELYSLHINNITPDDPEFQRVQRMMRVALSTKQSG